MVARLVLPRITSHPFMVNIGMFIPLRETAVVTAAALSSGLVVALSLAGLPMWIVAGAAALAGFALRAGAIRFQWHIPLYDRR